MSLEAKNIWFRYGARERWILKGVSLTLEPGERVGLRARSGFGKTTLCRLLAGYEKPEMGEIRADGTPLASLRGYLPVQLIGQHPEQAVNPRWKMRRILQEGRGKEEGLLTRLGGREASGLLTCLNGQTGAELPARLGIREEWLDRYPSELSGGELQRFCIARALGEKTRYLLADEITAMLDLVAQSAIWQALLEETGRRNIGLLVVSHSDALLERICGRIVDLEE